MSKKIKYCCDEFIPFFRHFHNIAEYAALNGYAATPDMTLVYCPFCGEKLELIENEG